MDLSVGDFNGDGFDDVAFGRSSAGFVDILYGRDDLSDFSIRYDFTSDIYSSYVRFAGDIGVGGVVRNVGDINSDGVDDLVLLVDGVARVLYGDSGESGARGGVVKALSGGILSFNMIDSVSFVGDVNGDGIDDYILGASLADGLSRIDSGISYLVYGDGVNALGTVGSVSFSGAVAGDKIGMLVAGGGDVNGDGSQDFIIAGSNVAYVVSDILVSDGSVDLGVGSDYSGFKISTSDAIGSVSIVGDLNGDGYDDVAVGLPSAFASGRGAVAIIYGGASVADIDLSILSSLPVERGFVLEGIEFNQGLGSFLDGGRDIDGDGIFDLLVGSRSGGAVLYGTAGSGEAITAMAEVGSKILIGSAMGDTLSQNGQAGAVILGGGGADTIMVSGGNFARIDGGSGHDVLILTADLDLGDSSIASRLSGIEEIHLSGFDLTLTRFAVSHLLDGVDGKRLMVVDSGIGSVAFAEPNWLARGEVGSYRNAGLRVDVVDSGGDIAVASFQAEGADSSFVIAEKTLGFSVAPSFTNLEDYDGDLAFSLSGDSGLFSVDDSGRVTFRRIADGDGDSFPLKPAGTLFGGRVDFNPFDVFISHSALVDGADSDDMIDGSIADPFTLTLTVSSDEARDAGAIYGSVVYTISISAEEPEVMLTAPPVWFHFGDDLEKPAFSGNPDFARRLKFFGDAGFGENLWSLGDINNGGGVDFLIGGTDDDGVYLFFGNLALGSESGTSADGDYNVRGSAVDLGFTIEDDSDFREYASQVVSGGDFDNDGNADYIIVSILQSGSSYDSVMRLFLSSNTDEIALIGAEARFGDIVFADIDGDGADDLVIADPLKDSLLVIASRSLQAGDIDLASDTGVSEIEASSLSGVSTGAFFGLSLANVGDSNGVVGDELLVGSGEAGVAAHLLSGGEVITTFRSAYASAGRDVRALGDINGDNLGDFFISEELSDGGVSGVVVFGTNSPDAEVDLANIGDRGFRVTGLAGSVSDPLIVGGDFNGDLISDIIAVSANGDLHVVLGKFDFGSGARDIRSFSDLGFLGVGVIPMSLAFAGDVDGAIGGVDIIGVGKVDSVSYGDILLGFDGRVDLLFGYKFGVGSIDGSVANSGSADNIIGDRESEAIMSGGGDLVRSFGGNDTITSADSAFRFIDGGTGVDQLTLQSGSLDFDGEHRGKVLGIEVITLSGAEAQTITLTQEFVLTSSTNSLLINGATGDIVNFADDGWVLVANFTRTVDGVSGYKIYKNGEAEVIVAPDFAEVESVDGGYLFHFESEDDGTGWLLNPDIADVNPEPSPGNIAFHANVADFDRLIFSDTDTGSPAMTQADFLAASEAGLINFGIGGPQDLLLTVSFSGDASNRNFYIYDAGRSFRNADSDSSGDVSLQEFIDALAAVNVSIDFGG